MKGKIESRKLYLVLSFTSRFMFSLIFTVSILYQVMVAKLDPLQLILVGTIVEFSVFLFEIPTGLLADVKSRKLSLIIGYILMGIGFIFEGSIALFWTIAIAQVIWGLGYTFISGSSQAWVVDEIGEDQAENIFIKGAQIEQLGELIAIPVAITIGMVSLRLPIIIGGVMFIGLGIFLSYVMGEKDFKRKEYEPGKIVTAMIGTVKDVKTVMITSKIMFILLLTGLVFGLQSEGIDRLWSIHLLEGFTYKLEEVYNPVILFGVIKGILLILSPIFLEMINRRLNIKNPRSIFKSIILSTIIIVLSVIGFGLTKSVYHAIILYLIIGVVRNIIRPLYDILLNKLIKNPNIRATIFSVRDQFDAIGQIAGGPIIGVVGRVYSVRIALISSAIVILPVIPMFKVIMKKWSNCNIEEKTSKIQ